MVDRATHAALNTPAVQAAFDYHQERLRDLLTGRPIDSVFVLSGIGRTTEDDSLDWEPWLDESLAVLAERAADASSREVFRPLTVCYNRYGVHFVDNLFGAHVFWLDH